MLPGDACGSASRVTTNQRMARHQPRAAILCLGFRISASSSSKDIDAFRSWAPDNPSRVFQLHASKHVPAFHRPSLAYTHVQGPPTLGAGHAQPG
jgi:hypothetical protein